MFAIEKSHLARLGVVMRVVLRVFFVYAISISNASAASETGSYIAFDILQSSAPDVCDPLILGASYSCSNQAIGQRIAVGHNLWNYFGIEGAYFDSGDTKAKINSGVAVTDFSIGETAFQLAGVFRLRTSKNISYYAKFGMNRYVLEEIRRGGSNSSRSDTGSSPLWGVGVELKSDNGLGIRLQYEEHRTKDTYWGFGTSMRTASIGLVLHPSVMNLHGRY